jgi:hypothetical protein
MEAREKAERGMSSPMYSSMYSSIPPKFGSAGAGGADDETLRGAVLSFNAKMHDKYGSSPEEIPSTDYENTTPRTPGSPAYSSILQEGGGSRSGSGTSRFIPQIPMGVLDSYLNSRNGKRGGAGAGSGSGFPGMQQMQMGGAGAMMAPTMNVPLIATMPMTMPMQMPMPMPMQIAAPAANTVATGGNGGNMAGGGGGTAGANQTNNPSTQPNAEGVKTLSIKI